MITFIPVGGLANRMRAVDAAIRMAGDLQTELKIVWYKDWGLNCRFDQLFQPLDLPGVTLKEATFTDLLYDRPRRKNFYLPHLFNRLRYDACIYEDRATDLYFKPFDFKGWAAHRSVLLASCIYFYGEEKEVNPYARFTPAIELQQQINQVAQTFNSNTIGIHIRRTDHADSISGSPTELFIHRMEQEIAQDPDARFYLATDSEEDKTLLRRRFGERIITCPRKAERGSLQGMHDALIELYLLSRTRRIVGSFRSSYSEAAARIGGIVCETLQKEEK